MAENPEEHEFSEMPGPWGIPILGSMLTLGFAHPRKLMDWGRKYYGSVYRYKVFNQDFVVLNSPESMKEGLVRNGTRMDGRESRLITDRLYKGKGIFFTDYGEIHQRWKPFTTHAFAEAMQGMADRICEQGEKLLLDISRLGFDDGEAIDMEDILKGRLAQIALISFINKRYDEEDVQNISDYIYDPFRSPAMLASLYLIPSLSTVSPFKRYLDTHEGNYDSLRKRFADDIRERIASRVQSEDIVSTYINESNDHTDEDIEQLASLIIDCVFAGTTTCAAQILWVVLFLLKHPDRLTNVKQEIRTALDKDGSFERLYRNRSLVPLLQACIQEAIRLRPIAPKSLSHKTVDDAVVGGYKIPKGVVIIPNIWSVHHDPDLWSPDPESFRPERHLDAERNFISSENVIPFSLGGRRCAGEKLARANIFIITAMLLSRYDFDLAPESVNVDLDGELKAILRTPDFKIVRSLV